MKSFISLFMTFISLSVFAQDRPHVLEAHCSLTASADQAKACLLQGNDPILYRELHFGLHYGSLHTQSLHIEVFREEVSNEKLEQLATLIKLEIEGNGQDFNSVLRELKAEVVENQIVYRLEDPSFSSFYIASFFITRSDEHFYSISDRVKEVFGPRAIAVVSAKSRLDF